MKRQLYQVVRAGRVVASCDTQEEAQKQAALAALRRPALPIIRFGDDAPEGASGVEIFVEEVRVVSPWERLGRWLVGARPS